jgi:AMP deaminase
LSSLQLQLDLSAPSDDEARLSQVVGFDCVDDESKPERRPTKSMPGPADWNTKHNAAYSYYLFYLYANLFTLNKFRCAATHS